MTMPQNNRIIIFSSIFMLMCLSGCASKKYLVLKNLETPQQILSVVDGKKLYLIDHYKNSGVRLLEMDANIISPVWSPDGKKIAFFSYGKVIGPLNLSSLLLGQKANLNIFDVENKKYETIGEFELLLVRHDPKNIESMIINPLWSRDGSCLYITDVNGVQQINLKGESKILLKRNSLKNVVFSMSSSQFACTDGKTIFLIDEEGKREINLKEQSLSFKNLNPRVFNQVTPDIAIETKNKIGELATLLSTEARGSNKEIWVTEMGNVNIWFNEADVARVCTQLVELVKTMNPRIGKWFWFSLSYEDEKFNILVNPYDFLKRNIPGWLAKALLQLVPQYNHLPHTTLLDLVALYQHLNYEGRSSKID